MLKSTSLPVAKGQEALAIGDEIDACRAAAIGDRRHSCSR